MLLTNTKALVKAVVLDTAGAFLYFPVWWYGPGLIQTIRGAFGLVGEAARNFGVKIWLKNFFKPMFGQRDIPGRIISLFFRLVFMVFYTIVLLLLSVLAIGIVIGWLALLPLAAYGFVRQLFSVILSVAP